MLVVLSVGAVEGFSLGSPRAMPRSMRTMPAVMGNDEAMLQDVAASVFDADECVVDAENLSEINACQDPRVEPKVASPNIFNSITSLLNKLAPKPAIDYDKDECIVFSENFEELQAC